MIPLVDDNKQFRRITPITTSLIVINSVVFLLTVIVPAEATNNFIHSLGYSEIPLTSFATFFISGLFSLFLHANILHILGNMIYLYAFGTPLENKLSKKAYLFLYFGAGYLGFFFYNFISNTGLPVIGASGAISGLIAAYLILLPKAKFLSFWLIFWVIRIIYVPAWIYIIFWILTQIVSLFAVQNSDVAYLAHIGGVAFGIGFSVIYKLVSRKKGNKIEL